MRWRRTLQVGLKARYREPYNARHSSVSWNLMIGKNPLWVAKQHGHSVQTMLEVYAAWTEGTKDSNIEAIKQGMERRPSTLLACVANDPIAVANSQKAEFTEAMKQDTPPEGAE